MWENKSKEECNLLHSTPAWSISIKPPAMNHQYCHDCRPQDWLLFGYSYYMLLLYLTLAPRGPNMVEPCWTPGGFPTGSPNLSIREVRCSRWEAVDPRPSWPWQPRSQVGAARAAAALPARMKINMERYHTMRQRRVKLDHMTWAKWKYRENPSRQ